MTTSIEVRPLPGSLESSAKTCPEQTIGRYKLMVYVLSRVSSYLFLPGQPVFNVLVDLAQSVHHHWTMTRVEGGGHEVPQSIQ